MQELSMIGKNAKRVDAVEKVTGRAMFCNDYKMPGMLHAKVLRSPYPHAEIVGIDTSKAEQMLGVRAVVTGKDVPDVRLGFILKDHYVLARDNRVRAAGEAVAAIAAETDEIAEQALQLIKVEYKELPAVFDPEEAMKTNPPAIIHPDYPEYVAPYPLFAKNFRKEDRSPNVCCFSQVQEGDVDEGFKEADVIVENRFWSPRAQHCQLETHRADAWIEPDGTLAIRTSTQGPWMVEGILSDLFNLPLTKIRVLATYVGGAFGGKHGVIIEPIVALLAMKLGMPVRLVLTREEQFLDSHQKPGIITYIKDGVKKDGTIIARQMKIIVDFGRHSASAMAVALYCHFSALSIYKIPNLKIESYGVYTNNPITGPFRGFGVPEITLGIEQQMDIIAEKMGIDSLELRKMHILQEGDIDASGRVTEDIGVGNCLDKVADWIEWGKKNTPEKGPWKKGKGIAIGNKFTAAGWYSAASVKVHPDATIEVRHGASEVGQGLNTELAQIAAEEFNTSIYRIKIVFGDTAFMPFDESVISSRCTVYTGNAVRRACWDAKRQIFDIASGILKLNPTDLEIKDGEVYVPTCPGKLIKVRDLFTWTGRVALKGGEIIGKDYYHSSVIPGDPDTGKSLKPVLSYTYGAHAVEVAVNVETGQIKILRIAGAFDLGNAINPMMVEGQIEGGMGMGIGLSLSEQIVLEKGVVANPNLLDYKVPGFTEMPTNKNVKGMIIDSSFKEGPFGAKGVGEATMVTVAPAIGNAVYNAVGIRLFCIPILPEIIWEKTKE